MNGTIHFSEDESFSSGGYDTRSPMAIQELSDKEQLEHNVTTAMRIDHFLTQYCGVDTSKPC